MNKKQLEQRLKDLEKLKENHTQDLKEISWAIKGLTKQIRDL